MNGEKLILKDVFPDFSKYDFSDLWLKTKETDIYGVIGEDNRRIRIKILTIIKNKNKPSEYLVRGKSNVEGNVCDFNGKITIQKMQKSEREVFGVDNEFKELSKTQGLLIAKYEFVENRSQKRSGVFRGTLKTKWYLNGKDQVRYDDLNAHSDGFFNNAFVGYWKGHNSQLKKKCNWGDFRVPNIDCNFDIGTGEFSVAEKYSNKGWLEVILKNKAPNGAVMEAKPRKLQKAWWQ